MPRDTSLRSALASIGSNSIKERQEGLELLTDIFSVPGNCIKLQQSKDGAGLGWLQVFQCLFGLVATERTAALKQTKTSAAAINRLQVAAGKVRWLIEVSHSYLSLKPVNAIFSHLTQSIIHDGAFVKHISMDYIKALKTLLNFPAHLESLDAYSWRSLMSIIWDAVLQRRLQHDRDDWDAEAQGRLEADFDALDSEEEPVTVKTKPGSIALKRTRGTQLTQRSRSNTGSIAGDFQSTSFNNSLNSESVELLSLFPILLSSSSAPILAPPKLPDPSADHIPHRAGIPLLHRVLLFLERFPTYTTSHRSVIQGLNKLLGELELNAVDEMTRTGAKMFPLLVKLWSTRDLLLREQLLISIRIFLPFLARDKQRSSAGIKLTQGRGLRPLSQNGANTTSTQMVSGETMTSDLASSMDELRQAIVKEAGQLKRGIVPLDLDCLALRVGWLKSDKFDADPQGQWESLDEYDYPLISSVIKAGPLFKPRSAASWATLEVNADLHFKLHLAVESGYDAIRGTAAPPTKRVKRDQLQNPVHDLLASIIDAKLLDSRLLDVQTLYFIIERYWQGFFLDLQAKIHAQLVALLKDPELLMQQWAFICLTSILLHTGSGAANAFEILDRQEERAALWQEVWIIALRRINLASGPACRGACLIAGAMIDSGILDDAVISTALEGFFNDIVTQGPAWTYDTVCNFTRQALIYSENDTKMYRLDHHMKVIAWFRHNWRVAQKLRGANSNSHLLLSPDAIALLVRAASIVRPLQFYPDTPVISTDIYCRMVEENRTKSIRNYVLFASLPVKEATTAMERGGDSRSFKSGISVEGSTSSDKSQRILDLIQSELAEACQELTTTSASKMRSALDLSVFAIIIVALLAQTTDDITHPINQYICDLSRKCLDYCFQPENVALQDRCLVLSGLTPILGPSSNERLLGKHESMWPTLVMPDDRAGVISLPLEVPTQNVDDMDQSTAKGLLIRIWQTEQVFDLFIGYNAPIRQFLEQNQTIPGIRPLTGDQEHRINDDFGPIRQEEDGGIINDSDHGEHAEAYRVLSTAISAIVNPPYYNSEMEVVTKETELYNIWLDTEDISTFVMGQAIFEAIGDQRLRLTTKALASVTETLTDLLRSYVYKRLPSTRMLLGAFLSATLYALVDPAEIVSTATDDLLTLWHWYADNLEQGRLESWLDRHRLVTLLDNLIERDPSERRWYGDGLVDVERPSPSALLLDLLEDSDIRLRFRIATSVPRLLQLDMHITARPSSFYSIIARHFLYQGDDKEILLSRAVLMTNVVIASSGARRAPLFHLYDCVAGHASMYLHIEVAFQAITALLRLDAFSELYLDYAIRLLAAQGKEDQDPLRVPVSLYGFQSRTIWARKTIGVAGASLLLSPECEGFWQNLVEVAQLDKTETLKQSLASAVAMAAAMRSLADTDGKAYRKEVARLKRKYSSLLSHDAEASWNFGESQIASMMSAVFQLADETNPPSEVYEILRASSSSIADQQADTYRALLFPNDSQNSLQLEETITPKNSVKEILRALELLGADYPADPKHIVCNTVLQIVGKIANSCLTNERRRLVYSLALLIAYYPTTVIDDEIFDVLFKAISCLFHQPDLSLLMVNFLNWALLQLSNGKARLFALTSSLSAIASSAKRYSDGQVVSVSAAAGAATLALIEGFMRRVLYSSRDRSTDVSTDLMYEVFRLLALWPRTLPEELEQKVSRLSYGQLRDQAAGEHNVGKFLLSKQLARHAPSKFPATSYRRDTFWQLRSAISDTLEATSDDMKAFISLLYNCDGIIEMPDHLTIERLIGSTGVPSNELCVKAQTSADTAASRRRILKLALDDMFGNQLKRVQPAYKALAGLASISPSVFRTAELPSIAREQLSLLAPTVGLPSHQLQGLQQLKDASVNQGVFQTAHKSPSTWIAAVARILIEELGTRFDKGYLYLLELLHEPSELASSIIPPVLHLLLQRHTQTPSEDLYLVETISEYMNWLLSQSGVHPDCLRVIVQAVLYLRNFQPPLMSSDPNRTEWLRLDLRAVSVAALNCKLPETALLFWELHRGGQHGNTDLHETDSSLLYDIYDAVEEPDGFYGVPLSGDARSTVLKRLHHEDDWAQAFSYHGADFEVASDRENKLPPVARSLRAFGLDNLASTLLRELSNSNTHVPLDLAWRTRQWDVPILSSDLQDTTADVYRTLRSVHHARDPAQAREVLRIALRSSFNKLGQISIEDMAGIRAVTQTLLCLREVDNWYSDLSQCIEVEDFSSVKWQMFRNVPQNMEYPMADEILNVRLSLIASAKSLEGPQLGDMQSARTSGLLSIERDCLTAIGVLARNRGDLPGAISALTKVQSLTVADAADHRTEFAEVLWLQGQHSLALGQLKSLLRSRAYAKPLKPEEYWLRANVLSLLGQWTAEAKQATENEIREDYFKPAQTAVYKAEKYMTPQQVATVTLRYAQFADQQFQAMNKSQYIKQLERSTERQLEEVAALKRHLKNPSSADRDAYETLRLMQKESQRDSDILKRHQADRLEFLRAALSLYAKIVASGESHDNLVLRFCAIWLDTELDDDTNIYIQKALKEIPSHKFVDLAYQLTARLRFSENNSEPFRNNIHALVTRICAQHPFHIIYQVLTLAAPAMKSSRRVSTMAGDRERAAFAILNQVRLSSKRREEIDQMEKFARTAISWAKEDSGRKGKDGNYTVIKDSPILTLQNMVIPVPTLTLPVDPTGAYKGLVALQRYNDRFALAGGIHRPKIMTCVGSDGSLNRELFKAEDDTRQDTIMEQLFRLVNDLLDHDAETRRRKLAIRTYNVLSLAEETGIIQFVKDTMSLAEYLLPAHEMYNKNDLSVKEFRDSMRKIQNGDDADRSEKLIAKFKENRRRFHPVFRNFFTERKKEPLSWFAMRLAYSRSLAVSNIVGHIVGIGDRHCSNILIDVSTGEMVHIDFGVAFGQGRALPIPELIPFRLTADLVDGLGSSGTQGVYQRCSENTLRVTRDTSEQVLAILEVFKHDPLHRWKITAETMKKVQDGLPAQRERTKSSSIGDMTSTHADMALADVRGKLDQRMSVEYAVNEWNRNAQDPANLAVIFIGWSPWL